MPPLKPRHTPEITAITQEQLDDCYGMEYGISLRMISLVETVKENQGKKFSVLKSILKNSETVKTPVVTYRPEGYEDTHAAIAWVEQPIYRHEGPTLYTQVVQLTPGFEPNISHLPISDREARVTSSSLFDYMQGLNYPGGENETLATVDQLTFLVDVKDTLQLISNATYRTNKSKLPDELL